MKLADWPDLDAIAERWAKIAERHPTPRPGQRVRIIGRRVSGVVLCSPPVIVRDGTGAEHEADRFTVRAESA